MKKIALILNQTIENMDHIRRHPNSITLINATYSMLISIPKCEYCQGKGCQECDWFGIKG